MSRLSRVSRCSILSTRSFFSLLVRKKGEGGREGGTDGGREGGKEGGRERRREGEREEGREGGREEGSERKRKNSVETINIAAI